ncbi:uncharacterized protein LOC116345936 [Contarinia nasturtii]|uniref:uncharacterized protein LOC116345936 n=1 Tax=Contarinia nasturtii TaxID=265458 RepID=UPI0012D3F66C|nr:uncharacterized protein LOC116345936 [Contarinia nasturtii]
MYGHGSGGSERRESQFHIGQRVFARDPNSKWPNEWFKAKILGARNKYLNGRVVKQYKIHYEGYNNKFDSYLDEENIKPNTETSSRIKPVGNYDSFLPHDAQSTLMNHSYNEFLPSLQPLAESTLLHHHHNDNQRRRRRDVNQIYIRK